MKYLIRYASPVWLRILKKANPAMKFLGMHDGLAVVKYKSRIWKVIGGGPEAPTLREVYRADFTRPA